MKTNKLLTFIITLALFSIFYGKTIFAKPIILPSDWARADCTDYAYVNFSKEKNPPTRDQCREYCHCLFSYDEKTEAPFTFDNITVEHIDRCKAKFLKIESTDSDH